MNGSKGLIVKEKILFHLLAFQQYSDLDEVPELITQGGIAKTIFAPRPHVSMALKDLRNKEQIIERICHIEKGKRRQKVYFLTNAGHTLANSIKSRILAEKMKIITASGQTDLTIAQACSKHSLSIFDLLAHMTPEGYIDLTKPLSTTESQQVDSEEIAKVPTKLQHEYKQGMPPPEESLPRQSQPHPQPQHAYPPHPIHKPHPSQPPPPPPPPQVQQNQTEDRQYQYPNYHDHNTYYPEYSNGYSYQQQYPYPPSKPLFMLSEKHRIFKLLLIGVPIMVYILILAMIDPNLSYYDLGLWLFIIISAIMIANFGTFIPVINRAQIIGALGIIILIDSPLALVLNTLNVFQIGFWYLIGLIYIFISYDIIINDQNQKNEFELKPIEQLAPGIVFGLGLGIIIACIYFHLIFDLQDLSGQVYFIYTILIIWSLIAVGLIIQGIRKNNEMAAEIVMGLQMALPIFFGIILILFGIFLIGFEKLIETIIETFLGGILIVYGIQNVKNQRTQNLIIIGLIILAFIITIVFSLYIN